MRSAFLPGALLLGTFLAAPAWGATITIAPGDDYTKIEAAKAGDEVVVQPGTYQFRVYLSQAGTAANPIVIRAADPSNPPVWDLSGKNVESWPGSYTGGDNGRGCWQVTGSYYEISGIEITGCHTSGNNAAGIRTVGADHITIRDAYLHDNDDGYTGDADPVALEFCEIAHNGHTTNPPQHNVYVYGGTFALRYSYVHDSLGGQNLHIRAHDATIEYNWLARAENYEADLMTGDQPDQKMLFRGNVVLGNTTPGNSGQVLVLYNDQGQSGVSMSLRAIWNTFVIRSSTNPALVHVRNDTLVSANVEVSNNIVSGTDQAVVLADTSSGNATITGKNNWFPQGASVAPLTGTLSGSSPGFGDAAGLDFTLASGSVAIGAADQSVAGAPDREYFQNETNAEKFRWRAAHADLGAFESTTTGSGFGPYDTPGSAGQGGTGTGGSAGSSGAAGSGGTGGGGGQGGAAGGAAGAPAKARSGDSGGCGCRAAPRRSSAGAWVLALSLVLVGGKRRGFLPLRRSAPS